MMFKPYNLLKSNTNKIHIFYSSFEWTQLVKPLYNLFRGIWYIASPIL